MYSTSNESHYNAHYNRKKIEERKMYESPVKTWRLAISLTVVTGCS